MAASLLAATVGVTRVPAYAVPEPTISLASNTAPAGFLASDGTAPNATPYCESPDYFDEWNRVTGDAIEDGPWTIDTGAGQNAGGVVATLTENFGTIQQQQERWGIRFAGADNNKSVSQATVTLSEPIFYSQWVVMDLDIANEGFRATASLGGDPTPVGAVAAFGANTSHDPTTVQPNVAQVLRVTGSNVQPWDSIARAQYDFLGPVDTVVWEKLGSNTGTWGGFIPGGGCTAMGAAKELTGAPVWDSATQTFSAQYTVRLRSNMPTGATLAAIIANAAATVPASSLPDSLVEIPITEVQIADSLVTAGATVLSTSISSTSSIAAVLNPAYDGVTDTNLVAGDFTLAPETTETIVLDVVYAPDFDDPSWASSCLSWTNQVSATGFGGVLGVSDLSDNGSDPRAAELNGSGTTDDPTPASVCVTPELETMKTNTVPPVLNADGSVDVAYTISLANNGDLILPNANVVDDLIATFGAGSTFTNMAISADGPCAGNEAAFDGVTQTSLLLDDTVTLMPPGSSVGASSCSVDITFTVVPGTPIVVDPGTTYSNTAVGLVEIGELPDTTSDSTVDVTVAAPAPELDPDVSSGNATGDPTVIDVLANDGEGQDLDPTSVFLIDPLTGNPIKELVVPGEGTWTVDPLTGEITFVPEVGFTGNPTAVDYEVSNLLGASVVTSVSLTYAPPAEPDASTGNTAGSTVVIDVLANDGGDQDLDPTSVFLIDPATGEPVRELVVPGEGTWTVDPLTGEITFGPIVGFTGNPTAVEYQVSSLTGDTVQSSVSLTYNPRTTLLAFTGSTMLVPVVGAALLALGLALMLFTRRRDELTTA